MVVAVFLFFAVRPPAAWLERRIGHPLLSYTGVMLAFLGVIILVSQILFSSLSGFSSEVPSLEPKFNDKINWLEELEVFGYSIDLEGLQTILSIEEINRLVTEFIGSLASFTANMLTVLIFLAFIILEAESLPGRVMAAFPNEANRFDNIASKAEKNINVYIKTKATVAFGQGSSRLDRPLCIQHPWCVHVGLPSFHPRFHTLSGGAPLVRTPDRPGVHSTPIRRLHRHRSYSNGESTALG